MADLNVVTICGRVGKDPELRTLPDGKTSLTSFGLANSSWKKEQNGEWTEETSWFDVTLFGDTAKRFVERTKKGHKVIVVGSLKQRTWEAEDGTKREKVQINARQVQYLEKAPKKNEPTEETAEPKADVPF